MDTTGYQQITLNLRLDRQVVLLQEQGIVVAYFTMLSVGLLLNNEFERRSGRVCSRAATQFKFVKVVFHTGFIEAHMKTGVIFPHILNLKTSWRLIISLTSRPLYFPSKLLVLGLKVVFSSGTSVDFYQTTRRYTPSDGSLYSHLCGNSSVTQKHALLSVT